MWEGVESCGARASLDLLDALAVVPLVLALLSVLDHGALAVLLTVLPVALVGVAVGPAARKESA